MRSILPKILGLLMTAALLLTLWAPSAAASEPPWVTGDSRPEDIQIKVVIFSPGDDVPSWFGHIALVVEDVRFDHRRLYNYGMFSFDRAMLAKFAMGRLWFWVGEGLVYRTFETYKAEGRDVRLLTLNLPDEQRMDLARHLAWNVRPENRDYLYHHYQDNCSTRIRDLLDKAVGGQLHAATDKVSDQTLRDHTRRHAAHNPPMEMLLMFLMNDSIDQPITRWDEMFLPGELEDVVRDFTYEGPDGGRVPLVSNVEDYYRSGRPEVPDRAPTHWPGALGMGVLLGGLALVLGRQYFAATRAQKPRAARAWRVLFGLYHALIGLVIGVPGLALAIMAMGTDHTVTYHNETLFLANPLTFLILPLGLMLVFGSARAARWLRPLWMLLTAAAVLLLPLKFLPAFDQNIVLPAVFILPILVGFCAAWMFWCPTERLGVRVAPEGDSD